MSEENKMCLTTDQDFDDKWEAIQKTMSRVLAAPGAARAELCAAERRVRSLCRLHFGALYVRIYIHLAQHVVACRHRVEGGARLLTVDPRDGMLDSIHLAQHVVACRHRVEGGARLLTVDPRDGMLDRYVSEWAQYRRGLGALDRLLVQFRLELRSKRHHTNPRGSYEYGGSKTVALEDSPWPQDMVELGLGTWQHFMLGPVEGALWPRVTAALLAVSEGAPLVHKRALRAAVDSARRVGQYDAERRLDGYQRWVHEPYLVAADTRHAESARALLEAGDVTQYMRRALAGRQGTHVVASKYLHRSSRDAVVKSYERAAITPHLATLQAAAADLLAAAGAAGTGPDATGRADLKHLHQLLREQDGLQPVREAAGVHVLAEGRGLLAELTDDHEMPQRFVHAVRALHRKYTELFADVFPGEPAFLSALDEACTAVVRSLKGKECELLARHCDQLLRAWEGAEGDAKGEEQLAAVISIFKRIDNTDAFYDHYQKALAIWLLDQSGASTQREVITIDQLRAVASGDCTRKLYKMLEDVTASATLNGRFKLWHEEVDKTESSDFSVLVLQKWAWPLPESALPVPAVIKNRTDLFSMWYGEQHPRHRLAWHQSSTGQLALRYTARLCHVTASVPQCAVLLAFETEDCWSSEELRRHLQLQHDEWVRQLQPLLEVKLLLSSGDVLGQGAGDAGGAGCGEGESTLTLNLDFADERASIKIACAVLPPVQPTQSGAARRGLCHEEFLHAKIARVMKRRQTLQHDELVKEVEAETRPWFSPAPELITKCIESLIRKEYLERVADKSDTYAYLP